MVSPATWLLRLVWSEKGIATWHVGGTVCVCGRCNERCAERARDLQSQAKRLMAASYRSQDSGDQRRAQAYVAQARAARHEAQLCKRVASPSLLNWVASSLARMVALVVRIECKRVPHKWARAFIR